MSPAAKIRLTASVSVLRRRSGTIVVSGPVAMTRSTIDPEVTSAPAIGSCEVTVPTSADAWTKAACSTTSPTSSRGRLGLLERQPDEVRDGDLGPRRLARAAREAHEQEHGERQDAEREQRREPQPGAREPRAALVSLVVLVEGAGVGGPSRSAVSGRAARVGVCG